MGRKISGVWHMDGVGTFFNLTALIYGERSIDTQSALLSSWPGVPTRVLLLRVGLGFLWVWLGFACVADLAFAGCRGRRWIPFSFFPYSVFEFFLSGYGWIDPGDCANGTLRRRSLGMEEALMTSGSDKSTG
jgi:hypothetical protein